MAVLVAQRRGLHVPGGGWAIFTQLHHNGDYRTFFNLILSHMINCPLSSYILAFAYLLQLTCRLNDTWALGNIRLDDPCD
jgi:hypothetical protein